MPWRPAHKFPSSIATPTTDSPAVAVASVGSIAAPSSMATEASGAGPLAVDGAMVAMSLCSTFAGIALRMTMASEQVSA